MTAIPLRRVVLASALAIIPLIVSPESAQAQTSRYQTWAPPGTSADTQNLLKDLKALVDEAEKARAADSVFLRDLRALIARYEQSGAQAGAQIGSQRLLFDDFADGEFTRNPTWTVESGEYWIEQGYGLRSKSVAETASDNGASGKISKEQLALSILGAVLQGANKNKTATAPAATVSDQPASAVLRARARISNAFSLSLDLSSWTGEGAFAVAVAVTQGANNAGYRVLYTPKQTARSAALDLVRVTSRGEVTLSRAAIDALEDQKNHSLQWVRGKSGRMSLSIDGKQVLNTRDTSFRDPFDAVALINTGADVIVKSVEVLGTK